MVLRSRASRVRWGAADLLARGAIAGGIACAVLATRNPWWVVGVVPLLGAGIWLTVVGFRSQRDAVADEALEAAAEYDRAHPESRDEAD